MFFNSRSTNNRRMCIQCDGISFIIEVAVVALATMAIGWIVMKLMKKSVSTEMLLVLAITGALVHVLAQVTGVNSWYCSKGVACRK